MLKKCLLGLLLFFLWNQSWSQVDSLFTTIDTYEQSRSFDETKIEAYRAELNYQNDPQYINNAGTRLRQQLLSWLENIFGLENASLDIRFILYVLMGAGLILLVYYLFKSQVVKPFARNNDIRTASISISEMTLTGESIEGQIKDAAENGNFSLVMKLQYIQILKLLNEKNLILWKEFKTNGAYIKEIEDEGLKIKFTAITDSFEKVAYGEFPLDKTKYEAVAPMYIELKNQLKKL